MLDIGRNVLAPLVAWRAQRIADPVERLRFLRRHAPGVQPAASSNNRRRTLWAGGGVLALAVVLGASYTVEPPPVPRATSASPVQSPIADVWLVDTKPGFETYSNGLRIETDATVTNGLRHGVVFDANDPERTIPLNGPVGIIYHTTESDMAPFNSENKEMLRHLGESILRYVARNHSYHYLIDRFGTVHRVVAEESPANHAGHSLWADKDRLYVNLNESFIGVSFETQTQRGDELSQNITPAQIHSARVLTEMLRAKYHIAPENCATHAQVSVNPKLVRIGDHTDWASNFPFSGMGLPDNYELPVPSLERFGFNYDDEFVRATGSRMWRGLALAEQRLTMEASRTGKTVAEIRVERQALYQRLVAIVRGQPQKELVVNKETLYETGNSH
jgi:hypothetical protein